MQAYSYIPVYFTHAGDIESIGTANFKNQVSFKEDETNDIETPANNKIEEIIECVAIANYFLLR